MSTNSDSVVELALAKILDHFVKQGWRGSSSSNRALFTLPRGYEMSVLVKLESEVATTSKSQMSTGKSGGKVVIVSFSSPGKESRNFTSKLASSDDPETVANSVVSAIESAISKCFQ